MKDEEQERIGMGGLGAVAALSFGFGFMVGREGLEVVMRGLAVASIFPVAQIVFGLLLICFSGDDEDFEHGGKDDGVW